MRARYKYIKELGKVVEITSGEKDYYHYVQDDTMEPTLNPADGKIYDSKSKYRRTVKEKGLIEFGNDVTIQDFQMPDAKSMLKFDDKKVYDYLNGEADSRLSDRLNEIRYYNNKRKR